jgi:coproporphyrinogen III oxidase-like Fe-S oxidoreductase
MTIEEDLLDRFVLLHAPQNVALPLVALRRHWSGSDAELTRAVEALVKKGLLAVTGDLAALTPAGHALVSKQPTVAPPFAIRQESRAA